jgi:predicted DNA-binding transcriptional regulator AlpA
MSLPDLPVYLTSREFARLARVTVDTVEDWRHAGTGPEYVKFGPRCTRYLREDVERWLLERTVRPIRKVG